MNCWEFKKCGREPGGINVTELGVCPACTDDRYNGVHGGANAGRACWVVAGTYCQGSIQGSFAGLGACCLDCDFYRTVRLEEMRSGTFKMSPALVLMRFSRDKKEDKGHDT